MKTTVNFSERSNPIISRRLALLAAVVFCAAGMLTVASAQTLTNTYLDATSGVSGNTTLADGATFTPPLNGTTGLDNNWEQRTVFGSSGNIYEAGGENGNEDAPEIRTTISGLTPGVEYVVYVLFWDPASTAEDWSVRAGFTANPGANIRFCAPDATGDLTPATGAILASDLVYSTAPTIFSEGARDLRAGLVGTNTADSSGIIRVYIDDGPAAGTVNRRTWYDGVAYARLPDPNVGSTVITPPVVAVGGNAVVSATVAGTPPFSLQWLSNGVPVLDATNTSLNLNNLQLAANGSSFSLVVSNNPLGIPTVVTNTAALLTVRTPLDLLWLGSVSSDWNFTDINWDTNSDLTADVAFSELDSVQFTDLGSFVSLNTNVHPGAVLVSNEFNPYFIGGTGSIDGMGVLIKQGAAALTLDVNAGHSGGTLIEGGGIFVGTGAGAGAIGTGPVTNNAGLTVNRTGTLEIPGNISGTAGITNNTAGAHTVGNLILSGNNSYSGDTELSGGTLTLANDNALGNSPGVTAFSTIGGASGGTRVNLSGGVKISGKTYTMNTTATPDYRCVLNGSGTGGVTNEWAGPIVINGDGRGQIRSDSGSTFVVSGNITGNPLSLLIRGVGGIISGTVNIGSAATFQPADGSTWMVSSTGNTWGTNKLSGEAKLVLGANNALPTGSVLDCEAVATPANQLLDLNGFNQQLAQIVGGYVTITNRSLTADSMLTYAEAGSPSQFFGFIADGARKLNFTIANGTLSLTNPGTLKLPASTVTIANGGVLDLAFDGTNTVGGLVTNGISVPPGLYNNANSAPFISGAGSLLVPSPIADYPTNLTVVMSGGNLDISWPATHLGWLLEAQTNSLSVGLTTNWALYNGGFAATTNAVVPVDSGAPSVFFRLRSP
jgi:autotransporter-associated beta strand protein